MARNNIDITTTIRAGDLLDVSKYAISSNTGSRGVMRKMLKLTPDSVPNHDIPSPVKPAVILPPRLSVVPSIVPPVQDKHNSILLSEKYRPTSMAEIMGNPKSIHQLNNWIKDRKLNPSKKNCKIAALLNGPPGVGKTTSATVLLKEAGYNVIVCNASDDRTKQVIYKKIIETVTRKAIGKPAALVLDELDGSTDDVGDNNSGILGVLQFINEYKRNKWPVINPIICIGNDMSHKLMRQLSKETENIRFFPPFPDVLSNTLRKICQRENIKLNSVQYDSLIESARGDIRRLIQLLQLYILLPKQNIDEFTNQSIGDEFADIFS